MALPLINVGTSANDGTGDTLRDALIKANAAITALNAIISAGAPVWQVTATATGASQDITLTSALAAEALAVYVNGLRQRPTTDYTVVGTTLTITAPATSSILIEPIAATVTNAVSVPHGLATITVPTPARFEHSEVVAAVGVLLTHQISLDLAAGTDSDENGPEDLDLRTLWATPGPLVDQITVGITFTEPTSGPIKLQWSAL